MKEYEKATARLVDLDKWDPNFDNNYVYYERFPHVLTTNNVKSASYVGILNTLTTESHNNDNQTSLAFSSYDNSIDDLEVTDATLLDDDNNANNFVVVSTPEELPLVHYVINVEDEDENDAPETHPPYNCVIC